MASIPTSIGDNVVPITREQRRSRRVREVRKRTISAKRTTLREVRHLRVLADADLSVLGDFFSPSTRGDCAQVERPCPHVSCKYHLYLDVQPTTHAVILNFPDVEPGDLPPDASCSLDVADAGGCTLERTGELMNWTRERVRQVEEKALRRAANGAGAKLRDFADESGEKPRVRAGGGQRARGLSAWSPRAVPEQPADVSDPVEDERDTLLLRGLTRSEQLHAERWARITATLVLVGYPLREAQRLANVRADEAEPGDPLPALFGDAPAEKRTPAERLTAPPPESRLASMVPREDVAVIVDDLGDVMQFEDEPGAPAERPTREARTLRTPRPTAADRPPIPRATPARAAKEKPMIAEDDVVAHRCVEILTERGPMAVREIVDALKEDPDEVRLALGRAKHAKLIESVGMARAARCQIVGEKRKAAEPVAEPKPAKKAAATKAKATKPKPNGKNGNGHAKPAKSNGAKNGAPSLFEQLAQQLVADHAQATEKLQKKLEALKVLADG